MDNTESIFDIIKNLWIETYYNAADQERRLEKIKQKEVRNEQEGEAKDNGTFLILEGETADDFSR